MSTVEERAHAVLTALVGLPPEMQDESAVQIVADAFRGVLLECAALVSLEAERVRWHVEQSSAQLSIVTTPREIASIALAPLSMLETMIRDLAMGAGLKVHCGEVEDGA